MGCTTLDKRKAEQAAILDVLRRAKSPMLARDVAAKVNLSTRHVTNMLSKMRRDGLIRNNGNRHISSWWVGRCPRLDGPVKHVGVTHVTCARVELGHSSCEQLMQNISLPAAPWGTFDAEVKV